MQTTHSKQPAWLQFERLIQAQNATYLEAGKARIDKTTAKVAITWRGEGGEIRGRARKGNVDFVGSAACLGGRAVCFDAKSCKGRRFPLKNLSRGQLTALRHQATAGGAVCFILIQFADLDRYFLAHLPWILAYWKAWDYHQGPASIPIEVFDAETYEVHRQGRQLDYLATLMETCEI